MAEAWDLANEAAAAAAVELRPCDRLDALDDILSVMQATWGEEHLLPSEILRAHAYSGNVPYGAYDGDRLIGYVFGWVGVDPEDGLHTHSHMLAALPDRRHRGIGYALKLAQRAQCLEHGIGLVRWTFDPLVSRNAWFNLVKLGARADRFERDFYGSMQDEINRGERSDRLVMRWDLLDMRPGPRAHDAPEVLGMDDEDPDLPLPVGPGDLIDDRVLLRIPREYHELRTRDPELARTWRDKAGDALDRCFADGFEVAGFTERNAYVLQRKGA